MPKRNKLMDAADAAMVVGILKEGERRERAARDKALRPSDVARYLREQLDLAERHQPFSLARESMESFDMTHATAPVVRFFNGQKFRLTIEEIKPYQPLDGVEVTP